MKAGLTVLLAVASASVNTHVKVETVSFDEELLDTEMNIAETSVWKEGEKPPTSSEEVRFIPEYDDEGENEVAQLMKVQWETDENDNAVELGSGNDGYIYLVSSVTADKKYALKVFNEIRFPEEVERRERELEVTRKLGEACREEGVAWIAIPYAPLTRESGSELRLTESKGRLSRLKPVTSEIKTPTTKDVTSVPFPPILMEYLGKGYTVGHEDYALKGQERQELRSKGKKAMVQHLQQFAADALEAVTFIHKHGVTHSDLRWNMFVDGELRVRVIDFGWAQELVKGDEKEHWKKVSNDWGMASNAFGWEVSIWKQKDGSLGPEFKDTIPFTDKLSETARQEIESPYFVYETMVEHPFVKEVFESRRKKEIWVQIVDLNTKTELNGKLGKLKESPSDGKGTVKVFGYRGLYELKKGNIQKVERQVGIGKQETGELQGYHSGKQRYEVMTEGKVELYPLEDLSLSPMKDDSTH